jgi:hypothetical protein
MELIKTSDAFETIEEESGTHLIICKELEIIPGPSDAPTHTIECKKLIIRFDPLAEKHIIRGQSKLIIKSK